MPLTSEAAADRSAFAGCDFRYGWRWLVPSLEDRVVLLGGAIGDDIDWWRTTVPSAVFGTTADGADAWIVDADRVACPRGEEAAALDGLRIVSVVGSGARIGRWKDALGERFPIVREYGLLPATAPRVVVPLSARRRTVYGLGLHRPGRRRLRLLVGAAAVLARFGFDRPLRQRVLLVAASSGAGEPQGVVGSGLGNGRGADRVGDFALYLGSPAGNRKTVVLPLRDLPPRRIYKTATLPLARKLLDNEAAALEWLAATPLASAVPAIESRTETAAGSTLGLEYRSSTPVPARTIDAAVVRFLASLQRLDHSVVAFADVLDATLLERLPDMTPTRSAGERVRKWLVARAESGARLHRARTHGDFAPWNCAWASAGLFVFDWEQSEPAGLALGDAFHYRVAPPLAAGRRLDAQRLERDASAFAARVRAGAGLEDVDLQVQLAAWALERVDGNPLFCQLLEGLSQV